MKKEQIRQLFIKQKQACVRALPNMPERLKAYYQKQILSAPEPAIPEELTDDIAYTTYFWLFVSVAMITGVAVGFIIAKFAL
jgi:hypothetical protein